MEPIALAILQQVVRAFHALQLLGRPGCTEACPVSYRLFVVLYLAVLTVLNDVCALRVCTSRDSLLAQYPR